MPSVQAVILKNDCISLSSLKTIENYHKLMSGATVVRSTDGLEVGGSNPTSAARLAESKGLETAPYLYLVLGTSVP